MISSKLAQQVSGFEVGLNHMQKWHSLGAQSRLNMRLDLLVQVKDYQVGVGSNPNVAVAVVSNNGHLIHTIGGIQIDGACISLLYRG